MKRIVVLISVAVLLACATSSSGAVSTAKPRTYHCLVESPLFAYIVSSPNPRLLRYLCHGGTWKGSSSVGFNDVGHLSTSHKIPSGMTKWALWTYQGKASLLYVARASHNSYGYSLVKGLYSPLRTEGWKLVREWR